MIKKISGYFIVLWMIIHFVGCSVFFEQDIEDDTIIILSPSDSLRTKLSTLTFWWESLNGASGYKLQIVSPEFDAIEKLVVDTNLNQNQFVYSLQPGKYQWRVRAENGGYQTQYFYRSFVIDSTLDLTYQELVLLNPVDNYYTNSSEIQLKWLKLYNATEYYIDIKSPDWNGNKITATRITGMDTVWVYLPKGNYAWGVRAANDGSVTPYSYRNVLIDKDSPDNPTLEKPDPNATFKEWPVELSWTRVPDNGSPLFDSLYIASDSLFTASSVKKTYRIDGQMQSVSLDNNGSYYWRVKTCDLAGNRSAFSGFRKFTVSNF